jgi:hypothetical protein
MDINSGTKIYKTDAKLPISPGKCPIIDIFHDNLASESCRSTLQYEVTFSLILFVFVV